MGIIKREDVVAWEANDGRDAELYCPDCYNKLDQKDQGNFRPMLIKDFDWEEELVYCDAPECGKRIEV